MLFTEFNLEDAKEVWEEEAREEGKAEGKAESVLELLSEVGEIPEELRTEVMNQKDTDVLTKWLKLAGRADSVELFMREKDL